jgi:asparagine synthase (glutamine-hydrolysing)
MCGFAGFLDRVPGRDEATLTTIAGRMADTLALRGPDDRGVLADVQAGYAVGFRRLAIVDLSPEGHQPMSSASDRYLIAFNGEVYNHGELRKELLQDNSLHFRGHSDTEVMLAAIERWGVVQAVRRFAGMFAFALWDRREKTLVLARDRLGEKPLYYGWMGDVFLFGSELKALRRHPQFQGQVDRDALVPYLRHGYIPAPHSVYENIFKLLPGTTLTIRADQKTLPAPVAYWSVRQAAAAGQRNRLTGSVAEMTDQMEQVLRRTIGEEMVADVPLGAFLSGGVDSSAIVALMQAQSSRPVRTFTVGFHEKDFNEAEFARAVAKHLGTDHTELYLAPGEALKVIPLLPELYDEPFADSSQIPTYLVARMARQHVTVSLSGDGGDEIFAGYNWYRQAVRLWRYGRCLPSPLSDLLGGMIGSVAPAAWRQVARIGGVLAPAKIRRRLTADRFQKGADLLRHLDRVENMHQWLISTHWNSAGQPLRHGVEPASLLTERSHWARGSSVLERLQCFDMLTYLPDDILVKVDRASMGVSLESRAPFLDHRVVEFALRVPPHFRLHEGQTKWLLRQVLYRYVPRELIERPKQGFSVPLETWLRGPLRDWAEALLQPVQLAEQGFFRVSAIRQLWQEHLAGTRDWQRQLWNVLMFQAWLQQHHNRNRP